MIQLGHMLTDIDGAREEIFNRIQKNMSRSSMTIYFDGWHSFGTAAVLRSIPQALRSMEAPPAKLGFDRILYIDCSMWKSKRVMQKRIAEELKLDHKIMAMFDEQDEEDDFNGVETGSRDVILDVAAAIDRTLGGTRFMIIFLNGSEDEIPLSRFGIADYNDCIIIWAFSRRFVTMDVVSDKQIAEKLRYTDLFLHGKLGVDYLSSAEFTALFYEQVANIVARNPCLHGIDLKTVVDCCFYGLHLHHIFRYSRTTGFFWPAHAPNYWICDGIIQGDRAREVSNALHSEISFQCDDALLSLVLRKLMRDPKTPFLVVEDNTGFYSSMHYRWISLIIENMKLNEHMQTKLARASSIFIAPYWSNGPIGIPDGFFKPCSNHLRVLVLCWCAFSYVSPPFLHCQKLRFLGLDHCTDDNTTVHKLQGAGVCTSTNEWACLQSLLVIDLQYTDMVDILLSEDKIELMDNLIELNMEGVRCSQLVTSRLQKRLPYLQRLRIIKPKYDHDEAAETSSSSSSDDIMSDSFLMDKTSSLETLDLSGNKRGMRNLPAGISRASHLQMLIVDGCDGLENIGAPNSRLPSSLRSFSFDGYGPASRWTSNNVELPPQSCRPKTLPASHKMAAKVSMISLEGCALLHNLFLRGLPSLVELDLSGCAIKILDFETMVVDVPGLKRLFLLGCEHLRAIRWPWSSSDYIKRPYLELLCIDTRPGRVMGCARHDESFAGLQVHAITTDARLARCLWAPIRHAIDCDYFNIKITSSPAYNGVAQPGTVTKDTLTIGSSNGQQHYADVFSEVGDGPTAMQAFPQPPTRHLDRHIEIGDGSRRLESECGADSDYGHDNLATLMTWYTESLYVHDVSTCSSAVAVGSWFNLKWCRVERCPMLDAVFPPGTGEAQKLETIWVSCLLKARCIWSKGVWSYDYLQCLGHLHLRSCPSLQFALPVPSTSFPSLKTLHIIHCGSLRQVFVHDRRYSKETVRFPKLTTIHLHDLGALQQICEATEMVAPLLESVKARGCWSLRRLPGLKGRKAGMRKPTVEMEKDVWDALEWDGVGAGHHPSLFQTPVHSRYYKQRRLLRGTVLR